MYNDEKTYDLRRRMLESIGNSLVQYWDDGEPIESFFILCAIGCLGSKVWDYISKEDIQALIEDTIAFSKEYPDFDKSTVTEALNWGKEILSEKR